jgi:hypothetical protein
MNLSKRDVVKGLALLGTSLPACERSFAAPATGDLAIIVRDPSGPVAKAAQDLAADCEKVLGFRPVLADAVPDGNGLVIEIALAGTGDRESFAIRRQGRIITLTGADMRGTIYAIYQFCQDYLGIDPMYYWTDKLPERRHALAVPDGLDRRFPSPVFEYRGFFINDEDQLTGWMPATPEERTNIAPAVMDKVYETILRLKGNLVVPSTWPFPDDPQIKAAGARGLVLGQHHATPVGMNAARWPADVPYSYSAHPEILRRAWKNAVDLYDPQQEILWSVGLRGLSDMSYADLDPEGAGNDARLGELITRAIAEQIAIVKARFPDAKFITNLWSEGVRLMKSGYVKVPPEVITVWADEGWGLIKDGGNVREGQGFYYHVAMLNGHANQLTEMVPIERIYSEFGRYIKAKATRHALVNTSDLRAVAMTAKATMDVAWGGVPAEADARAAYKAWAATQFGIKAADALADLYQDYFHAFAHRPAGTWGAGMEVGDQHYHTVGREILLRTMLDPPYYVPRGQAPKWQPPHVIGLKDSKNPAAWLEKTTAEEIGTCSEAVARWDAVWRKALAVRRLVVPARRDFYAYAILAMIAANRNSAAMLIAIARASQAAKAGNKAAAHRQTDIAMAEVSTLLRYQSATATGKWRHWWRGEWLDGVRYTSELLSTFTRWIDDPIETPSPEMSEEWKGYYRILRYEGGRSVDVR